MKKFPTLLSLALVAAINPAYAQVSTPLAAGSCSSSGTQGCGTGVSVPVGYSTPSTTVYPRFGIPQPVGGGVFSVSAGNFNINMWKAASGYYYPYCGVPPGWQQYQVAIPIIMNQPYNPPAAADPPVSTFIEDTTDFLDKAKKDKKISERDFKNLSQRLKDLGSKERYLRNQNSGTLDKSDAEQLRQDVSQVLKELQWRLGRNEKY